MKYLLFVPICAFFMASASAQMSEDAVNAPVFYQLYLDEALQSVEQVHYNDEMRTPLRFEIDANRTTLYLHDYRKRGSVTIQGTDAQGRAVEIRRSSCYIDPVAPS